MSIVLIFMFSHIIIVFWQFNREETRENLVKYIVYKKSVFNTFKNIEYLGYILCRYHIL